jgi:hypothetical protein
VSPRSSWPSHSARHWARAPWLCCACVLLLVSWPMHAAEPMISPSELMPSIRRLWIVDGLLASLEQSLSEQLQQATDFEARLARAALLLSEQRAELELWRQNSENWESSQADSQAALEKAQTLLAEHEERYAALSQSWRAYRERADNLVRGLERQVRVWRGLAIGLGIAAVVAGGIALARAA